MSADLLETIEGNLARRAAITSAVSSTESVVWVMKATLSGSGTSSASTSATVSIRTIESGASPVVPSTSSWPSWPIITIV